MYLEERKSLESLANEFSRLANKYPPLYHQQLLVDPTTPEDQERTEDAAATVACGPSDEQWHRFAQANTPAPDGQWQEWHGPYQGRAFDWFGRFYGGNAAGLPEFKQLVDSLYRVLRKSIPQFVAPDQESIDKAGLPVAEGYAACLELMHDVADSWPVPLLRSSQSVWGNGDPQEWSASPNGEQAYPLHPYVMTLDNNLFIGAKALIELLLDPDMAFFISDQHWSRVPFEGAEPDGGSSAQADESAPRNLFRLEGEMWHLRFGAEDAFFPNEKGFAHYALLLQRKGEPVEAIEIDPPGQNAEPEERARMEERRRTLRAEMDEDDDEQHRSGHGVSCDDIVDQDAVNSLRQRLDEIDRRLAAAPEQRAALEAERAKVRKYLNQVTTDKGRPRRSPGLALQAQRRVKRNLFTCQHKLAKRMPKLAYYFRQSIRPERRANAFRYSPLTPIEWVF